MCVHNIFLSSCLRSCFARIPDLCKFTTYVLTDVFRVVAVNAGASVSSVFGSIILQNLAGFTPDEAILLNMPFGALQFVSILLASWLAYRFKRKSPLILGLVTIVIVGVALMVALPKTPSNKGGLLVGYNLIAFVFAINPLLLSWMGGNCAGQTKKAVYYTSFNAGNSVGNIITPYIFSIRNMRHNM